MSNEYISRQAAIDDICETANDFQDVLIPVYYMGLIKAIPAADVVPVVRCEDCKHHSFDAGYGNYWCNLTSGVRKVKRFDYCSYGEKKE